jgi:hypothetical protein
LSAAVALCAASTIVVLSRRTQTTAETPKLRTRFAATLASDSCLAATRPAVALRTPALPGRFRAAAAYASAAGLAPVSDFEPPRLSPLTTPLRTRSL